MGRQPAGRQAAAGQAGGIDPADGIDRDAPPEPDRQAGRRWEDPESAAMEICLRLLTAAPRTRAQLADALLRRQVPQEAADAALARLAASHLIDDEAFAHAWVESRHYSRGLAARALKAELRQRGVSEGDVRAAIADLSPQQEEAAARRLVQAKLAATKGKPAVTRVRRLMGLLARKGYPAGLAYRVVREALEQEGIDPASAGLESEAVLDAETTDDTLDGLAGLEG